ncbi:MAG: CPBP family intramembrane metalloprotease, partial [Firmicutes bacterium]|nr:CPBP family intramembrane metalloprotease [Bacillota bacterium]
MKMDNYAESGYYGSRVIRAVLTAFIALAIPIIGSVICNDKIRLLSSPEATTFVYIWFYLIPVIVAAILFRVFLYEKISDTLALKGLSFKRIICICVIALLLMPLSSLLSYISSLFFPNEVSAALSFSSSAYSLWTNLFIMAVLPAICEEFVFRGLVFSSFMPLGIKKSIALCGLVFAIAHFSPQQFLYAFVLGCVFALFVYKTGSVLAGVIPHFVVNASQVLLMYFL